MTKLIIKAITKHDYLSLEISKESFNSRKKEAIKTSSTRGKPVRCPALVHTGFIAEL